MPKSNVRFCIEGERRKMAKAGLRLCVIRYCILNVFMHGLGDLFAVSNSFYHSSGTVDHIAGGKDTGGLVLPQSSASRSPLLVAFNPVVLTMVFCGPWLMEIITLSVGIRVSLPFSDRCHHREPAQGSRGLCLGRQRRYAQHRYDPEWQ